MDKWRTWFGLEQGQYRKSSGKSRTHDTAADCCGETSQLKDESDFLLRVV